MPWYHGWNVLAAGLIFQGVSFGLGLYCFTFYVTPWATEFGVGRGDVMVVFLILQASMGLLAPFAGRAMDRLPIRLLVCIGAVSLAAALLLAARATALWQLMLIYGTFMVGGTLLSGPLAAQTLTARWFNRRRGLAFGISTVGTSLGGFLLPPLVTGLQAAHGWRDANDLLALLVVVAVLPLAMLSLRDRPAYGEDAVEARLENSKDTPQHVAAQTAWTLKAIFAEPTFWLMVATFALFAMVNGALQQNLAPFGLDHGIDARTTAWAVSVMAALMALWKVVVGALADRLDVRWLFLFSLATLLGAMLWMATHPSPWEFAVICGLLGIAAAAHLPLLAAIISRHFGTASFGMVMGLVGPFTTLSATGPWLAGALRDAYGSYDLALLVFAVLLIPAAGCMLNLRLAPVTGSRA
ncbi:MAG: MFS transporter [Pseudomonadales bacterium]|nr:MFS transporter [Pseudomonadales bacterium]MCP5183550.1 MFS transporter [Pseudomonadales bacterium]